MKTHTTAGVELLSGSRSPLLQMAETVASTHHERWDGSGYPQGLRAQEIPLVGRLCAVCDVFDSLSSPRPYKEPWPFEQVLKEIRRRRGTHLDPELVDAFLGLPSLAHEHALASSGTYAGRERAAGKPDHGLGFETTSSAAVTASPPDA